jgi:hypothetical protein
MLPYISFQELGSGISSTKHLIVVLLWLGSQKLVCENGVHHVKATVFINLGKAMRNALYSFSHRHFRLTKLNDVNFAFNKSDTKLLQ